MCVIAAACLVLFLCCFAMTREHIKTVSTVSVSKDFKSLLGNKPWWLLIGAALCFNLFNTVRGATVAYFFADVIGAHAYLDFGMFGNILFYSGLFLGVGEIANMVGVALTVPIASWLGKKYTFIAVNILLFGLSFLFFAIPLSPAGYWLMLALQIVISVLTGIMSPLIWSMYADVSDYSELKHRTASTGLIFSSSSMAQKFGGALGGAAVLWLLSSFGYSEATSGTGQPESAITCLWMLMSFIPAAVAGLAAFIALFYPLTPAVVSKIVAELKVVRKSAKDDPAEDEMTDYANIM